MAKVLFFLQLIVAVVVLPLWPGLDPRYTFWGLVFLALVLVLPVAAVISVYGLGAGRQALIDAWSTSSLGPESRHSLGCWALALTTLPPGAAVGGLVALIGALGLLDDGKPLTGQSLTVVLFCLVWGILGLILGRVLQKVVMRLSQAPRPALIVLTPAFADRFAITPRETEAAQAVLDGLTYKDAAEKLGVSPSTVKSHVLSVYQKTGAGNKIELLRMVEARSDRIHQSVDGGPATQGRS